MTRILILSMVSLSALFAGNLQSKEQQDMTTGRQSQNEPQTRVC